MVCGWIFFLLCVVTHGLDTSCVPPVHKRAYATILIAGDDNLLRVRVLGASLKQFEVQEDVIVVMPASLASHHTTSLLKNDGFKVHIVAASNTKHIKESDLRSVLPLWCFSLTSYDRIVYLDPYSIVQHSLRSSFSCDGYCASPYSPNGPIILTPSRDTYLYLLKEVQSGERNIINALTSFYNLASCPKFIENEDISPAICTEPRPALSTCFTLPIEFGVRSTNYTPTRLMHDLACSSCGLISPRVITYPADEHPWESLLYTTKPIQWRWYHIRNSIAMSYDESKFAVIVFLVPAVLLVFCLQLHQRVRPKGSSSDILPELSSSLLVNIFCVAFAFTITSLWYHIAVAISRYVLLFTWPPLYSTIVSSMWLLYGLMVGMMMCDFCNSAFVNGKVQFCIEVAVFLLLLLGLRHLFADGKLFIPIGLILTNALICVHYIRYKNILKPIVTKDHLSWMFLYTFLYAVADLVLCLVECPEAMRSVLMRILAMSHAIAMVLLYTKVVCGERLILLTGGGDASLMCFSNKRENCSTVKIFRYLLNFMKVNSNVNMPCTLLYLLLLLLSMQALISLTSYYYPTVMPYVCFAQKNRFLSPSVGMSSMCGAREVAEIQLTDEYYEAYSQFARCIEWTRPQKKNKELIPQYLTVLRGLNEACTPDTEFTFTVMRKYAPWRTGFCIYNSRYGKFLSSKSTPQDLCRDSEMWHAVPSHTWTFIWSKLALLLWPLRYSFSYFHPILSSLLLGLTYVGIKKAPIRSPGYRATMLILGSLLAVYLAHIFLITWTYSFKHYHSYTLTMSNLVQSLLNRIGVMTGPKFLKLISTSPDQCPETINLLAHVTFLICPVLFMIMLCDIIDSVSRPTNKRTEETEEAMTRSPSQLVLESNRREDEVQDAVTAIAQLTSCAIGAVSLQAVVTLAVPIYNILSPTCHLYEDRFRLISFQFEYLENVVLFANMLCVNSVRFHHSKVSPIMGFAVFGVTYVMIWLIMDTSYALFIRGLLYVYVSWTFIMPRTLDMVRNILIGKPVVNKIGDSAHMYELVNIDEEDS